MFSKIKQSLLWYKKLIIRLMHLAFFDTVIVTISTIFSQLFLLISTMVPLKILMLLSSPKIPNYFPESWQTLDKNSLILYFMLGSIICFIIYLVIEKVIDIYSLKGSTKILKNNKKIILFENQDDFAQKSYIRAVKSVANIIFFILSLFILGYVYPLLALNIILYIVLVYIYFVIIFKKFFDRNKFYLYLNSTVPIGFFFIFIFIISSFILNFYPPNITIVIFGILLSRQMFAKFKSAVRDISILYSTMNKIDSLFFFRDVIKIDHLYINNDFFWNILQTTKQKKWIENFLGDIFYDKVKLISSDIYHMNIKNMISIKVQIKFESTNINTTYLLKLFNKNIKSQALHEVTLFQEYKNNFFGLKFIDNGVVADFYCNIFEFKNINYSIEREDINKVRISLMKIIPQKNLENRYRRSHPYIYLRLQKTIFYKLKIVFGVNQLKVIKEFENDFDSIMKRIKQLPLQIINPSIRKSTLVLIENNLSILYWGKWKIDILGVDYPIEIKSINILKTKFVELKKKRRDLKNIQVNDVILVALVSQFEKFYIQENFTDLFEVILQIMEYQNDK